MLSDLGLTWKIFAKVVNDVQIELQVGRLPKARHGGEDLVNISDVGLGVSQVLPVLVSLLVAKPGQLVYLEQPELHLHPRAQYALAKILAEAAKRGVKLVVETHSALLLLNVQTLVAEQELNSNLVKLHWFSRSDEDGTTEIESTDLDENGAFGDWPEDFGDVELKAEGAYLDAVEGRSK
jgi:predicted ATPase